VDSNADLAVKKSEAAQRQQNAAIATDVAVRQQQVWGVGCSNCLLEGPLHIFAILMPLHHQVAEVST
jgi:hypothetical protein